MAELFLQTRVRSVVWNVFLSFLGFALYGADAYARQTSVTLESAADNTLYESETGALSNGAGVHLFAGETNAGQIHRALIYFNVQNALPAGATVDSVEVSLFMSKSTAGPTTVSLHRVLTAWGEGVSDASGEEGSGAAVQEGDATWLHSVYPDEFWVNAGGDFDNTPSSSRTVTALGSYTWASTARLVDDVRDWSEHPENNFGWLIRGDESASRTAKRFDSRENLTAANRPKLRIYYSTPTFVEAAQSPETPLIAENYPNPFTGTTTIAYEIGRAGPVRLEVFDVLGRRVVSLLNAWQTAGRHEVPFDIADRPTGVYLYRLDAGGRTVTHTMTAVR